MLAPSDMTMKDMQALPPKVPDFVRMGVSSERSRQRVKNSRSCGGGGGEQDDEFSFSHVKFGVLKM